MASLYPHTRGIYSGLYSRLMARFMAPNVHEGNRLCVNVPVVGTHGTSFINRDQLHLHRINSLWPNCFSSRLAVAFVQYIKAMCLAKSEDVVGAAPIGDAPTTSEWSTIVLPTIRRVLCYKFDGRSWSALVLLMACCLPPPSHWLNQWWLIIGEVLWHSPEGNFTENTQNPWHEFEID